MDRDDSFAIDETAYAVGGVTAAVIQGMDGNDRLSAGSGTDTLLGGAGDDRLVGGPGNDFVLCDDGNDVALGGGGNDRLRGDGGDDDQLDGGSGDDDVRGGPGADLVRGGDGADRLGDGADQLDPALAGASWGPDVLEGGPGSDTFDSGPKAGDTLIGGAGIDSADYSQRTAPLTIDIDGQADDGESGEGDDVKPDVERVSGGSDGDTLIGSDAVNFLDGRGGADVILGMGGDDTLEGGVNDPSGDTLVGGTGNDTMQGESGDDALKGGDGADSAFGSGGSDRVEGEAGNDSVSGGPGSDTVDGGEGDDKVNGSDVAAIGGDGDDRLFGGPGTDDLRGGRGNDELDGGLGADTMDGESETDTVTYADRTHEVFVSLDGRDNDGEANEHDNVINVEQIVGGRFGDTLSGDGGPNTIAGGRGQDLIDGRRGVDQLQGGAAGDVVMARDGATDVVACGGGNDLAIADRQDKVSKCNTVDVSRRRRLIVGRYALVRPRGRFGLRLPQGTRFFTLRDTVKIPIGAAVDPRAGVVRLATARNRAGARRFVSVSEGRFTVRQTRSRRPITRLWLAGRLPQCGGSSSRLTTARRTTRKLRFAGAKHRRGKARQGGDEDHVRGEYSDGSSKGTEWITEDRCDGTLTTVISGTVRVRDFGRAKTVTVRAGHKYLAKP
jgi:Ca2+-binding RTX toxin-like protein